MVTPTPISDSRAVATQSSARKPPKNISELPRSRMTISMSIASPHTSRSGPKCFGEGRSRTTAANENRNTPSSTEPAEPRHYEQADAHGRDRVAVAPQHVVVANQQDRHAEDREARHEPLGLL